jgi:hypothetical protein
VTATPFNFDATLARLRERADEAGYDIADGYCERCDGKLTEADVDLERCTQCGKLLSTMDGEDLEDDGDGDY